MDMTAIPKGADPVTASLHHGRFFFDRAYDRDPDDYDHGGYCSMLLYPIASKPYVSGH